MKPLILIVSVIKKYSISQPVIASEHYIKHIIG
jgi:hypothetical protein